MITQGGDVGTQYRSGIYYYTEEQQKAALESMERQQKVLNRTIVTEILPAKRFYRAEEYHQQYLEKGGRFGFRQSARALVTAVAVPDGSWRTIRRSGLGGSGAFPAAVDVVFFGDGFPAAVGAGCFCFC